jgi:penicillin-binding protein 2
MFFKNKRKRNTEIDPDEIFLDSRNLPEFNVHQFEGRIEHPISQKSILFLGFFFLLVGLVFLFRLGDLQISSGSYYDNLSKRNHLRHTPIFPERGVIYDKNGVELAWNTTGSKDFSKREYIKKEGFSHVLGYINYPKKDKSGFYFQEEFNGEDGVELSYDDILSGKKGIKITEVDVFSNIQSESIISPPVDGDNIVLSIDSRLQGELFKVIKDLSSRVGFKGGAGIIMDVNNGEVLALSSFPEYDSNILSNGDDSNSIKKYISDKNKPFLNRIISGLYTPGSTVKLFMALGALEEGIINPSKQIYSSGSISVQNPYFPEMKTVFKDWKAHGWVDMRRALAVSSNVYFYAIGGGYEDQKGLGISKIERYAKIFGLNNVTGIDLPGEVNGIIPNPEWKRENFNGENWRIGDTYHTIIGQYGFQITPIQLARATAAIANNGKILKPSILINKDGANVERTIDMDVNNLNVIKEGMRMAVTEGTAKGLNIPQVSIAAKSGTAELGVSKALVNSWITGYFPYENPKYVFTVVMEKGDRHNLLGALFVMRQTLEWMSRNTPEYLKK